MAEEEVAYYTAVADYDPKGQEVRTDSAAPPAVAGLRCAELRARACCVFAAGVRVA